MSNDMTDAEALEAANKVYDALEQYARTVVRLQGRVEAAEKKNATLIADRDALAAEVAAHRADAERLGWLESQAKSSRTGISFDWCKYAEDGYVQEKGFRFMRHHYLGERATTLRGAIDAARAEAGSHD